MMDRNVSAAFCVPFFGPLPPYFIHWVKSCEINQGRFHWYLYSDQVRRAARLNPAVTVIPYGRRAMVLDFKKILGIEIHLENLRKICDWRLLFYSLRRSAEPLDEYDFIGYTDMDMIYGDLARFMPENTLGHDVISADDGHPCGPFTLMRREAAASLAGRPGVREEMERSEYREFDESPELLEILSPGGKTHCLAHPLQPAMAPGAAFRNTFAVWDRGRVTVWDRGGRRREGGFHHFSRFKGKRRFRVRPGAIAAPAWGVCKFGILPVTSRRAFLPLVASLFI